MLYTPYTTFVQKHFDGKMQKLPVDAGCTCPVRDGQLAHGGCAFCNACSFVPPCSTSTHHIVLQLEQGKHFFQRKYAHANVSYLAYFQAGSNTYCTPQHMMPFIIAALQVSGVKGIVLATRPDCISSEWLDYLIQLNQQTFVMIELGIESVNDEVLTRMGRGHNFAASVSAIHQLHAAGIPVCVHLIIGLPGETRASTLQQADEMNRLQVEVIKLHQLQYLKGSRLGEAYLHHPLQYHVLKANEYAAIVADYLERLSPSICIERFVSQSPSEQLIAPRWGLKNDQITQLIVAELNRRGTQQGYHFLRSAPLS